MEPFNIEGKGKEIGNFHEKKKRKKNVGLLAMGMDHKSTGEASTL